MLRIAIGYGNDHAESAAEAVKEYNAADGRKTFHYVEHMLEDDPNKLYAVTMIWFTQSDPTPAEAEAAKQRYEFIGSTDIDPRDPNWKEKWEAQQDALKEQAEILEDAETDWFLNTEEFPEEEQRNIQTSDL